MLAASSLLKIIVIAAYRFSSVAPLPFGIRATSAALYNKGFTPCPALANGRRERPYSVFTTSSSNSCSSSTRGSTSGRFPQVLADLTLGEMNPKTYDFIEQGFDIAIHTRTIRNSRIKVKRIATIRFSLCLSPGYLEQRRPPATPRDLFEHAWWCNPATLSGTSAGASPATR
jgi:hypothetical protein